MLNYIIKRVLLGAVTMFAIITLTFFLMQVLPGGPFLSEKAPTPAVTAALEAKYGLNKPVFEQYLTYLKDLLKGDLGPSIKNRGYTVTRIISEKLPISAKIALTAIPIALIIGVPFGCIAALKRNSLFDRICIVIATIGISIPGFIICSILLIIFGRNLGWLPIQHQMTSWKDMILPVTTLAIPPMANYARIMRTSMLDILGQDYMRTARAKGLSQTKSLFKHAMRNAAIPLVTILGPQIAWSVMGSLAVERILTIPGLGRQFVQAITGRDYPLVMGLIIFLSFLIVAAMILCDLLNKLIDHRIQLK